jgi:transcriptional antiterminator NusG
MSDQNSDPNTEEEKKDQATPTEQETPTPKREEAQVDQKPTKNPENPAVETKGENDSPHPEEPTTEKQAKDSSEKTITEEQKKTQSEETASEEQKEAPSEKTPTEEQAEESPEENTESILTQDTGLLSHEKKTSLKTSVGKQARNTGRNWYVIHTYSGYEDAVEKALRQRIESLNMHDLIFDIIVPKESTITIKKGEHVTEKKRLFPGYVLVEMIVTDESWYVVRNTPNVTGFVGSGTIPVPIHPEEFNVIQKHIKKEEPKFKINFQIGEQVIISDGPFKTYEGLIDTIDEKKGKLKVLVTIFGRETPVELDFVQVKKK